MCGLCTTQSWENLVREEFVNAIRSNQTLFGVVLSDEVIERLADYY
jgi:hypothetical protein